MWRCGTYSPCSAFGRICRRRQRANHLRRVADGQRVGWNISGYDRTGSDYCSFANYDTLQDAHVESNPRLVLHNDLRVRDMLPILMTPGPIKDIIAALLPV